MRATMVRSSWCAAILGLFVTASAIAGPLNGHANARVGATGSTPFNNLQDLAGFVDYAVFDPGQFPAAYAASGYTPTPGELTYTYQIFVTGTAPVSSFDLVLTDLADNIGSFSAIGGLVPLSADLDPMISAKWTFAGIPQGGSSYGLAFSSPRIPQNLLATVVDTGQSTFIIPLPSPSPISIPEPATLGLVAIGCMVLGLRRRV